MYKVEYCWVSQVQWEDGKWETVADCMPTRKDAVIATRAWFRINEMEPEPFQVYRRVLQS